MRTEDDTERDDIWRWIWDDADELGALGESPEAPRSPVLVAVPKEDDEHDAERDDREPPGDRVQAPFVTETFRRIEVAPPIRSHHSARKRRRRRFVAIGMVAATLAVVAAAGIRLATRERVGDPAKPSAPSAVPPEQHVAAFALWDEDAGPGYLAVLAAGGGKEPVAVALPDATSVTIPGHGLGTVADATSSGDVTVVQATVENILGVRVDDAIGIPLEELAPIVDSLGLLDLSGELANGDDVVRYLAHRRGRPAAERLARWQEVLTSFLSAARGRPEQLEAIPERLRAVFATGAEVVALPTEEIGAGLVTPDDPAIEELVSERFVPEGTAPRRSVVRLVVLNGNGTPGVGEQVARLLVPEGFRLVTNENAETFDLEKTQILASSREYLDEARLARRLIGVGEVFLDATPSLVTDVTVVVGDDFGRP